MLKVIEIVIDLTQPGSTAINIQNAVNQLPPSAKLLSTCATESSIFLFYDVPSH